MMKVCKTFMLVGIALILAIQVQAQKEAKEQRVKISTEFGDMIVKLYNDTPAHRDNFIENVKNGVYNGSLFHRVMPGFMMQGGDPNSINAKADQGLGRDNCGELDGEIMGHHFHKKGALSAARLPDGSNPTKKSSKCQFFIVQGYRYTDAQLDNMETEHYTFPHKNRAYYKVKGGAPFLDMQYTVFGEVVEGFEIIDLIHALPTHTKNPQLKDRPQWDVKMSMELIK